MFFPAKDILNTYLPSLLAMYTKIHLYNDTRMVKFQSGHKLNHNLSQTMVCRDL